MGKKDKEKMALERSRFIEGCARVNNIPEAKANTIFDLLEKFAGYGFNKSHSAAYALITYRTAFLKANYPVDFMAALLSNAVNDTDKISVFVAECQRMGIPILAPDVNRSQLKFAPEPIPAGATGIRFGLAAIKNVGEAAMETVIADRAANGQFATLEDFCARLDGRAVNKKILESLIRAGAMDFTQRDRAEMFARLDGVLAGATRSHRDRASGQAALFDEFLAAPTAAESPQMAVAFTPWTNAEKLAFEKELLGFYVTGHPLNPYRQVLTSGKYTPLAELSRLEDREDFKAAGSLVEVAKKFTKKDGKPFAVVTIEDLSGSAEAMVWNDAFVKCAKFLEPGRIVALAGRVDKRGEELRIIINEVTALKLPKGGGASTPLRLRFDLETMNAAELDEVRGWLTASPGEQPVEIEFRRADGLRLVIQAGPAFRVAMTPELASRLAPRLADAALRFTLLQKTDNGIL
jgi:DNA polymerase-3 subunit alpha